MFAILKSKFNFKYGLGFLGLVASLVWLSIFSFPDNRLHLVFCDVGQGDATLIRKGFEEILIDGGPNDKVLQCLANNLPFFDKTIEIVVLTHPEADHLTGLISVFDKYEVKNFVTGPEGNNSGTYQELLTKIKERQNIAKNREDFQVINIYAGEKIILGEIELDFWWPERQWVAERIGGEDEKWEVGENNSPSSLTSHPHPAILGAKTSHTKFNDFSLVFLLKSENLTALLMGDADSAIQDEIEKSNNLIPIDILKFPHHGSKTGIREDFLAAIQPKEAVISVGKNSYGHPTSEALELLKKYDIKVRRTDLEGEIKYTF